VVSVAVITAFGKGRFAPLTPDILFASGQKVCKNPAALALLVKAAKTTKLRS